jgi:hypothetical protein
MASNSPFSRLSVRASRQYFLFASLICSLSAGELPGDRVALRRRPEGEVLGADIANSVFPKMALKRYVVDVTGNNPSRSVYGWPLAGRFLADSEGHGR